MRPIRLALNATSLLYPHTGIASYTRNLALALRSSGEVNPMLFYAVGWSSEIRTAALPGAAGFKGAVLKLIPRPYWLKRLGVQQHLFNAGVRTHDFDIYHEPAFLPFRFDGPIVVTIHDLSPLRYPETHPSARVRHFQKSLPSAIQRAARIVVDSEFIRREVIEMFRVDPARVRAIHLGVADEYRPRGEVENAACLEKFGLKPGGYILAVGTLEPRKNLARAIEVHAALPEAARKRAPLVVVGGKGWHTAELDAKIADAERRGDLRWLGYVPAEELPLIYSGTRFLVYPSIYEGFGLPVLEAMASGVPVITSDQASLPEVAGDAGIMVDPNDTAALREEMLRLIEDDKEVSRRAQLGLARARRFTWAACAEQTVRVYRDALRSVGRQ